MSQHIIPIRLKSEGNGWSIFFPSLKGCFSYAETFDEIFSMSREAAMLHIEGMIYMGQKTYDCFGREIKQIKRKSELEILIINKHEIKRFNQIDSKRGLGVG